jgi:hypothetical protein
MSSSWIEQFHCQLFILHCIRYSLDHIWPPMQHYHGITRPLKTKGVLIPFSEIKHGIGQEIGRKYHNPSHVHCIHLKIQIYNILLKEPQFISHQHLIKR